MREMKDSGVEWIGEIPITWNVFRNKNAFVCSKELVGAKSSETQLLSLTTKGIKLKDIYNAEGKLPESFDTYQYVDENEIVMCLFDLDCSAVFSGLSPYSGMISPAYRVLTCTERMFPKYADYWFQYIGHGRKFNHYAKNIRYTLSYEEFSSLPMLFPKIDEQKKISHYLDSKCSQIDAIIEKQQAIIEKLKKYKLAVITEAVTKGIKPDVEMKKCHIRKLKQIPINWEVIKITRILDYESSYPIGDGDHGLIKTENYKEEGIPYIRVQNLGWGTDLLLDNVIYISQEDHDKIKGSELHPNDILFCKTGATIGKTGMIPGNIPISNTTSHVGKITIDKKYNPRFVFYYLSSFIGYVQFWDIACMKSTRPELSIEEIRAIMIAIPRDREEQDVIVQYLDKKCAEIERIIANKEEIKSKLLEYKKSLIYEVVTGKKEV